MPDVLKAKTLGLPRWAWLSILLAAIAIGLYLRHRAKVEEGEGTGEEAVSGPVGEYIEPPYEGESFAGGGGGSSYEGGSSTELNLERELQKEENQRIREGEKEENARLQYEAEHPPSGETAPSAQGAEQFPSGPSTGTSETPTESPKGKAKTTAKTATTGGGPPAKPNASTRFVRNEDIKSRPNPAPVGVGAPGGGGRPPATNNQGGAPQNNAQHPAAINTGNKCVNGGVGGHEAPSGYHLFCQGGYIWRAPNS